MVLLVVLPLLWIFLASASLYSSTSAMTPMYCSRTSSDPPALARYGIESLTSAPNRSCSRSSAPAAPACPAAFAYPACASFIRFSDAANRTLSGAPALPSHSARCASTATASPSSASLSAVAAAVSPVAAPAAPPPPPPAPVVAIAAVKLSLRFRGVTFPASPSGVQLPLPLPIPFSARHLAAIPPLFFDDSDNDNAPAAAASPLPSFSSSAADAAIARSIASFLFPDPTVIDFSSFLLLSRSINDFLWVTGCCGGGGCGCDGCCGCAGMSGVLGMLGVMLLGVLGGVFVLLLFFGVFSLFSVLLITLFDGGGVDGCCCAGGGGAAAAGAAGGCDCGCGGCDCCDEGSSTFSVSGVVFVADGGADGGVAASSLVLPLAPPAAVVSLEMFVALTITPRNTLVNGPTISFGNLHSSSSSSSSTFSAPFPKSICPTTPSKLPTCLCSSSKASSPTPCSFPFPSTAFTCVRNASLSLWNSSRSFAPPRPMLITSFIFMESSFPLFTTSFESAIVWFF